jgi:hypothetical protein
VVYSCSYNKAEVLALNEPLFATPGLIRRWVRHQNKGLAKSTLRFIGILSIAHIATDENENRHVFHTHLRLRLWTGWCGGGICGVDDLTVVGLHFIHSGGHLVDKDFLHGGAVRDRVAIEQDW